MKENKTINELINQNGGTALIIPPQEKFNIDEIVSRIDGIIITGGGDINPELYEEENTDSRNILDTRDSVEMKLLYIDEQNSTTGKHDEALFSFNLFNPLERMVTVKIGVVG